MKKMFCCLCFCLLAVFAGTDAVKSVSVMEGDSVSLNTSLTKIQTLDIIIWTFGDTRMAYIVDPGIFSTYDDVLGGRFRGRLKLDPQTGSLTITNIRTTDSGEYKVFIKGKEETTYKFNVTVYAVTTQPPPQHLIPLVSAAAVGFLLLIAAVGIFCIYRKRRKTGKTDQEDQARNEDITYADPTFLKRKAQQSEVKVEEEVVYAGVVTKR